MATSADYANWLRNNQDKRGTPNYKIVLQAYQEAALEENRAAQVPAPAAPTAQPQSGGMAALRAGATELGGGISALLGKVGLKDEATAQAEYDAAQQRAKEIFAPTQAGWTEAPGTKFLELLGGSVPYMVAPLAAGAAAATLPFTGPAALATTLGAAGLTSAAQFTATNLSRQMEEGKKLADTDLGAAALAAVPMALLDTAAMRLIPGIGRIFGQAGIKVTAENAKEIAEQGLKKTLIDYTAATGKTMGVEGLTEAAQQVLERAQAGLSLTDPKAREEYFDSFLGGAILGGTLAVPGRYYERGKAQGEARTLLEGQEAEQRKTAREAEDAAKKAPDYLLKLEERYKAAVAKKAELDEAAKKPASGADPATMVAYRNAVRARDAFVETEMSAVANEYAARKKEIDQLKERQRVEGMTPLEYQMEQAGVKLPAEEQRVFTGEEELPSPPPRVEPLVDYATKRIALANEQRYAKELDPKDRAGIYAEYLLGSIPTARRLVQSNEQLPNLGKRESNTVLSLVKEGLKKYDMQQAAKRQGSPIAQLEAEERAALEDTERAEAERLAETEERRKLGPELTAMQRMAARRLPESVKEDPYLDTVLERIARATPPEKQPSAAIGQTQQLLTGEDVTYTAEEPKAPAEPRRVKGTGEFQLYAPPSEEVEGRPPVEKPLTAKDLETRLASSLAREDLPQNIYELLRRVERTLPAQDTTAGLEAQKLKPLQFVTPSGKSIYPETKTEGKSYYELVDALLEQVEATQPEAGAPRRITSTTPIARAFTAEPTTATEEDLTLAEARQQRFADNLRKGMSRGEAAREAYDYARERAGRATKKGAKPETAERLGAEYETEVRAGQAVAPGAARRLGAPVTAVRGRSAMGPATLRGPSAATPEFDLDVPQELSLALTAFEQGRADTEAQLPLFPEGAEKGFILETPEAFKKFLEGKDRPRTMLQREQARFDKAREALKALAKEVAAKEKEVQDIRAAKDALVAARALVKADKDLTALVKKGETLQITTPFSISYIPNAKPALTQAAIDKMDVDERIRRIEEVRGARARVLNAADVSAEDKVMLLEIAQVYSTELQAAEAERGALIAKADYLLRAVAVEKALNTIAQLSGRPGADARIETLQEALVKAREDLSTAGITVSRADTAAAAQSAKAQRERAAVNRGLAETERTKRYAAQQAALERLEAAPGGRAVTGVGIPGSAQPSPTQELGATVYPALTEAQRLSREQPQPRITLVEQKQILGDPQKVLSGLQSRVSTLTEKLRNKTDAVRQMKLKEIQERKPYDELLAKYKAAKSAEERAAIEPDLQAAESAYNARASDVMSSVVVWKGYDKDITELATAVRKRDAVADLISSGAFKGAQPQPTRRLSVAEKEAADAAERAASAREAATRAGAPETTGEALTRTEATDARKAEKTVYQGKGVGVEERASLEEARLLREARQRQARGETLTPLEQFILDQDNRSRTKESVELRRKEDRIAAIRAKDEAGENLKPSERKLLDEADREAEATTEEDTVSLEMLREAEAAQEVEGEAATETETEIEDVRPLDAIFRSRGATANPSTTDSVRAELKQTFPDLGRVQIYDSVDALIAANPQYKGKIPADARGFVDSAGNKAFLIAENINQGQALSVLLHEVGAHVGLKSMLGDAQYSALINAVKSWEKRSDNSPEARVAQAARARVEAAETPAGQVNDELLAYAIEEAVNAGVKPMETKSVLGRWLSQIAALFRRALQQFGLPPKALDAQGLVDMAFGAAKMEMRGQGALAPRAQIKAPVSEAFKRWFGDSKVVDAQGKPLVVYHGSNADITAFDPAKLGSATEAPSAQLGFFFASEPSVAASYAQVTSGYDKGFIGAMNRFTGGFYEWMNESLLKGISKLPNMKHWEPLGKPVGGNVLPVYLSLQNPLEVDQQGKEYREQSYYDILARAKADGHDGVIIRNTFDEGFEAEGNKKTDVYVVFNPTQIKSATGNRGTYDPTSPNILFSRNLPTAGRVANQIVGEQKSWLAKLKDNFLGMGFRTQFIDKYFPTEEALKRAGADPTKAMQAMYYLRMVDQRMHFTSQAITDGVPERVEKTRRDGTKEYMIEAKPGANLKQAFDILKRKDVVKEAGSADAANKLVTLYMAAIRGENKGYEKLNFGRAWASAEIKRIEGELKSTKLSAEQRTVLTKRMNRLEKRMDSMPTPEDIKAAKAEIDANPVLRDAFNEVRDIYNQYNRDLITFNVQTGALSKEQANRLLQENDYIPYYRMRDGVAELMIGGETPIRIGNLKDSPHLEELVGGDEPIMDFITSSIQNTSMLIDMATHNLAMKNLMFEFKDVGLATVNKVKGNKVPEGAVTFKRDGEEYYGVVDTEALGISSDLLVKGLAGIPTMFPAMVRAMGMPARFLRRVVIASPLYMARQLFRDSLAASIASGANTIPVLGALKQIGKTDVLQRRGITGGQVFTGMPEDQARMIKDMQAGKLSITNGLAYLEGTSAKLDALTRRAQYESYIKQGLSEMEATYMALESMNFSRRGLSPSVHMASTLIPFFNAQIQGLDVLYRSFRGQMPMNKRLEVRKKLLTRGMMLFGLSFAYALAMQDDEAYKNAKPEEKYGNWLVSLPGIDEKLRLPIPFELGYIFKSLPEAIVNILANEKGGEEAWKAAKHIGQQMVPGLSNFFIPQAVKPLLEVGFGVSAYTGRDIESAREQQIEPRYRKQESTTELAKTVGELTGFSPIKVDFLIRGYTGQLGMAAVAALSAPFAGAGEGPAPATKRLSDLPLVGTLFQPKDASGIIDLVYERMNKVRQVQDTYKQMIADNKPEQAKRYAEEKANELSLASLAGAFREQMGQITEFERQVRASALTPDRKREELDRARQAKIDLSKKAQAMSDRKTLPAAPA